MERDDGGGRHFVLRVVSSLQRVGVEGVLLLLTRGCLI